MGQCTISREKTDKMIFNLVHIDFEYNGSQQHGTGCIIKINETHMYILTCKHNFYRQ